MPWRIPQWISDLFRSESDKKEFKETWTYPDYWNVGNIKNAWNNLIKNISGSFSWDENIPKQNIDPNNKATYWVDPITDKMLESTYVNENDNLTKTYIEKVWLETWALADIQNTDKKILSVYKMLEAPTDDIFNNPNISDEEKIALYWQRRSVSANRIQQLKRFQNAQYQELNTIAKAEIEKQKVKNEEIKAMYNLEKERNEENRWNKEFALKQDKYYLDNQKFWFEKTKYTDKWKETINSIEQSNNLVYWDFSTLKAWDKYNGYQITQTYGTHTPLAIDNVKLVNWKIGTPWVDIAYPKGTQLFSYTSWKVVDVRNGQKRKKW